MISKNIKLIECPRDAMQGWKVQIPTEKKIEYINSLLEVGFDTIDFGSFVSPKAIPQMADTRQVLNQLNKSSRGTKLLAIVANERGAEEANQFKEISYLGFPFSVSETFQRRNTNSSITESLRRVAAIQHGCEEAGQQLVVYISMGFGNPYGDPYSSAIVYDWIQQLTAINIKIISLADTVGIATPEQVHTMTKYLIDLLPHIEVGVHLHTTANNWKSKLNAALDAGCLRFDGALRGIGGCPMADDELVGNMNMEWMIDSFSEKGMAQDLDKNALQKSLVLADEIFY